MRSQTDADGNRDAERDGAERASRDRVFVTRSLRGLGDPDPLVPLYASSRCEVWTGDEPPTREVLIERTRGCRGLLCLLTDVIDARLLDACPELTVISTMSAGVDHIDLAAAEARGVAVGHTPGVLAETTADLAFALLLAAARRIPDADRFVRSGGWTQARRWEPDMLLGVDLHGRTLGIIGLGEIGRAVARRAQGFGMRVLGFSRSACKVAGVEAAQLNALLSASDFVSVHLPLTSETRGLLGASEIDAMKTGAVLVNTARGGIVDEEALAGALVRGHLAGAALDVFADEPLSSESPLLAAPNLVLSPHIGSATIATRRRMAYLAVENLQAGLAGRALLHAAGHAAGR